MRQYLARFGGYTLILLTILITASCSGSSGTTSLNDNGNQVSGDGSYRMGSFVSYAKVADLIAGAGQNDIDKGTDVGDIFMYDDAAGIHVRYELSSGMSYGLMEVHFNVGTPTDPHGNPTGAPGQFDYIWSQPDFDPNNPDWTPVLVHEFTMSRDGYVAGDMVDVYAHAKVGYYEWVSDGTSGTGSGGYGGAMSYTFYIGQNQDPDSTVEVWRDGDFLYAKYTNNYDYAFTTLQFYIGTKDPASDWNPKGKGIQELAPGQMPWSLDYTLAPGESYTFKIAIGSVSPLTYPGYQPQYNGPWCLGFDPAAATEYYVAFHVATADGNTGVAWGDGGGYAWRASWWRYDKWWWNPGEDEEETGHWTLDGDDTAWGYGGADNNYPFDFGSNKWGWYFKYELTS